MIQTLGQVGNNTLYIKREDLLPFSFGGNKARKAIYFLNEIKANDADCVVTYGSSSSNHCRVIANMAKSMRMKCVIVTPEENKTNTFNLQMMELFDTTFIRCSISQVSKTIERTVESLKERGYNPYFIMGGGHGVLGTQAYVDCFNEIMEYEQETDNHFDYIFHASGTGTTQAGLICGKVLAQQDNEIIGVSIARRNPYGGQVVLDSVREYMTAIGKTGDYDTHLRFVDDYVLEGYGKYNAKIDDTIRKIFVDYGIPLNRTYTGKAFWGMTEFIKKENIKDKNILFIHTGGTPLFFDYLKEEGEGYERFNS